MKKKDEKIDEAVTIIKDKMREYLVVPRAPMERERHFHVVLGSVASDMGLDRAEVRKKFGKQLRF